MSYKLQIEELAATFVNFLLPNKSFKDCGWIYDFQIQFLETAHLTYYVGGCECGWLLKRAVECDCGCGLFFKNKSPVKNKIEVYL